MIDLLQPFQLVFMQQAFIVTLLVCIPMALLSCYLVLKGWSLFGDAISHAVLPGVVIAYIINIPLVIGAFVAGMICTILSAYISEHSRVKEDTALGIVFSTMFGLGIVLYVSINTDVHLDHILFGNILGVTWSEILQTSIIAIIITLFLLVWRKDLLVAAFDSQHGRAIALPMFFLHYGLLSAISLTAVAALEAVGIILAIAFLVTPGAIAFLITRVFRWMMIVSVLAAISSTIIGIYISFFIDSAPAPTIVMVMSVQFIAAFIYSSRLSRITKI